MSTTTQVHHATAHGGQSGHGHPEAGEERDPPALPTYLLGIAGTAIFLAIVLGLDALHAGYAFHEVIRQADLPDQVQLVDGSSRTGRVLVDGQEGVVLQTATGRESIPRARVTAVVYTRAVDQVEHAHRRELEAGYAVRRDQDAPVVQAAAIEAAMHEVGQRLRGAR